MDWGNGLNIVSSIRNTTKFIKGDESLRGERDK